MTSPLLTARLAHPGRLLTYREVAGQLNVALRTVQRAVSAGALPVVRLVRGPLVSGRMILPLG